VTPEQAPEIDRLYLQLEGGTPVFATEPRNETRKRKHKAR